MVRFGDETFRFLRGLVKHNDRDWFEARREVYERALKAPMLALIEEINAELERFAPEHVRPPHKCMMRIYRDTRFSKDKRPYKKHMAAWWSRRGMEKTSGGGFYLQVGVNEVLVAAGVYMPEREQLLAIRRWMAENHEGFRKLLKTAGRASGKGAALSGIDPAALTRMPKGFPAEHPADELLRAKNWGVHGTLPAAAAREPDFARVVAGMLRRANPVVAALNEAIVSSAAGAPSAAGAFGPPAPLWRRAPNAAVRTRESRCFSCYSGARMRFSAENRQLTHENRRKPVETV